jgi:ketosteroid isomerase-like protein
MRRLRTTLLLLAATGISPVLADSDSAKGQIEKLYADYRVAVENADIGAYVDALHPNVRLLPPGAAAIVGANNYAGFLKPVFAAATYDIEIIEPPVIEILGDTATAEYIYGINLVLKNPSEGISEPGALTDARTVSRYFDVLRKLENGKWAIWRHTWSVVTE